MDTDYYCNRSSLYSLLGDQEKALDDCNAALKIDPQLSRAYCNRGAIYYKIEKYQDALNDLNLAISIDSKSPWFYNTRGAIYCKLMRYDKALDDFHQAISIDPTYDIAYIGLGTTYFYLEEYQLAKDYLTSSINIKNHYYAYFKRSFVLAAEGNYREAIDDLDNAVSFYKPIDILEGINIEKILETKNMMLEKINENHIIEELYGNNL